VDAVTDKPAEDVRMQVDQTWRHQLAGYVNDLPRLLGGNGRRQTRDLARLHGHIVHFVETY
jgi:hypothetical protein